MVFSSAEIFFQTDNSEDNPVCTVGKSLSIQPISDLNKSAPLRSEDMGLSQVDDACHHSLSHPTINTKEAMNAFSGMSKKTLLPVTISKISNRIKQKPNQGANTTKLFDDEEMEVPGDGNHNIISNTPPVFAKPVNSDSSESSNDNIELQKPFVGAFKILGDDEDEEDGDNNAHGDCMEMEEPMKEDTIFRRLKEDTVFRRLKEDTVIRKIVGSKVFDEPKVENACHHGLVDPTVNLKQAIDDINDMFGKPLNFGKARKKKKQEKLSKSDCNNQGFFILADDENIEKDLDGQAPPCISCSSNVKMNLFEPTLFTEEALNEINDLFGKSLDF